MLLKDSQYTKLVKKIMSKLYFVAYDIVMVF